MAGGMLPYGFTRIGKAIIKNRREVAVVRMIFRLKDGHTCQKIADYLNKKGLTRRNAKSWTQRQVSAILNREKLYKMGIVRYGKVEGKNENYVVL